MHLAALTLTGIQLEFSLKILCFNLEDRGLDVNFYNQHLN